MLFFNSVFIVSVFPSIYLQFLFLLYISKAIWEDLRPQPQGIFSDRKGGRYDSSLKELCSSQPGPRAEATAESSSGS